MDAIFPVPNDSRAQYVWRPIPREPVALVAQPRASVAEKWSSTNRIRSQFARIKAAGRQRYQLWLLRKTRLYGCEKLGPSQSKSVDFTSQDQGHFAGESQDISQAKVRTFRKRKSGNIRTIGRGDQAAHHACAGLGMAAGTARRLGLDHSPGAAIGQQGRQYGVVQLV